MPGTNPDRRYKGFRPRQAARGNIGITASAAQFSCCGLFNNSSGPSLLALRAVANISAANAAFTRTLQGIRSGATVGGVVMPLIPGEATPVGQLYSASIASANAQFTEWTFAQNSTNNYWPHEFPLVILPPGWSYELTCATTAVALAINFVWEVIQPDELDYMD